MWWQKNGKGPKWLGGYEQVWDKSARRWRRMFTLERIPTKGAVTKRTLYFTSSWEAKDKKWRKCEE